MSIEDVWSATEQRDERRFRAACVALQGLLAMGRPHSFWDDLPSQATACTKTVKEAVQYADALLAELAKEKT